MAFIGAVTAAVNFVFSGTSIAAAAIRFIGGNLLMAALQKGPDGPRIADKRVQTAAYGTMLPRLYGESVRVAGNVIDKSDLLETKRHRGGFGKRTTGNGYRFFGLGRTRYYTYSVTLAVAVAEGALPVDALQRIWANGRVVFDANAVGAVLTTETASMRLWAKNGNLTQQFAFGAGIDNVAFYRGDTIQPVDPIIADLHDGGDILPAYRNTAYVVIDNFQLQDFGNGVPNFEFELKTGIDRLGDAVAALASFAEVDVYDSRLDDTLHGYVVANASSAWDAIQPLAQVFNFDLVQKATRFEAIPRGRYMRTILDESDLAAVDVKSQPAETRSVSAVNPDSYPDIVTVSYLDPERDFQVNTQQAFRNFGVSQNKVDIQIPVTMTPDEAAQAAQRALSEALAAGRGDKFTINQRFRWLEAGDIIGIRHIGGNIEPFRLNNVTASPNLTISIESINEDPLAYTSDVIGSAGTFEPATVVPPGDTTLQLIDSPPVGGDDDTGVYIALGEASTGWVGADIERSSDGGVTYEYEGSSSAAAVMGICVSTLPTGPVDVWDRHSTVTVVLLDDQNPPVSATEAAVLVNGDNLAWIGNANGIGGEFINFATVTPAGSPNHYVLSNLLRGRWGTEWAVGTHGALERFVLLESDTYDRMDFGTQDWNVSHKWRAVTIDQAPEFATVQTYSNTGEGKRPLAPTLLKGTRDGSSNTLVEWTRRSRGIAPPLGGGPTPLQEASEAYSIDIYHSGAIVRTLTSSIPSVTYTSAMATADGNTPGAALRCDVYQVSDVRGRGHVAAGTV